MSEIKLTEWQIKILEYLRGFNSVVGSTEIGLTVGNQQRSWASAWACSRLKKLVRLGLVWQSKGLVCSKGYEITNEGRWFLRDRKNDDG